jgi:hypothetical protein
MKKYIILTIISLAAIVSTQAQEYKISKSSGKLNIKIPSVTVEGYDGNEIVFRSEKKLQEEDPRAKGLSAINGAGNVDNTGLGISVLDKGTTIDVVPVTGNLAIKILVPKGIAISYSYHNVINVGKVVFRNIESEIESTTDHNKVELDNVSGPVTVNALYGSVDAKFSDRIKGPISIASIHSTVDVAIPVTTAADVKLSAKHGTILASSELKIAIEKKAGEEDMISYGGNAVNGKLNGGGFQLKLNAEFGKIYLRKK